MAGRNAVVAAGVAVLGLGVFFAVVGLDRADKMASVLGAFIGLGGLALSGYGIVLTHRTPPAPARRTPAADHGVSNTFSGGTAYGPVVMGRDITGPVSSAPGVAPPPPPRQDPPPP